MAATLMGDDAKVKRKISLKKIAAITISKSVFRNNNREVNF